jgi:hypothetical protein
MIEATSSPIMVLWTSSARLVAQVGEASLPRDGLHVTKTAYRLINRPVCAKHLLITMLYSITRMSGCVHLGFTTCMSLRGPGLYLQYHHFTILQPKYVPGMLGRIVCNQRAAKKEEAVPDYPLQTAKLIALYGSLIGMESLNSRGKLNFETEASER